MGSLPEASRHSQHREEIPLTPRVYPTQIRSRMCRVLWARSSLTECFGIPKTWGEMCFTRERK